jgi:hypothetical protein
MLHKCWSCKTPIPLKAHDGRWFDNGRCPTCGANQPLSGLGHPAVVWVVAAVLAVIVLTVLFHIARLVF